ncbi:unnamed protein product [Laminaria digitata]
MSASIPFLKQPENLEGMVGDIGFDPFGLATIFPVKFMREAELKHGRVAMLAVVGWIVSEVVHVPGAAYMSENPVDAMAAVGPGPMLQIFAFCGWLEWNFHNKTSRIGASKNRLLRVMPPAGRKRRSCNGRYIARGFTRSSPGSKFGATYQKHATLIEL